MSDFLIAAIFTLLIPLMGYFFGCLNGSVVMSHFVIKDDVRKHGSGNAGLTNFYRTYGAKHALGVIVMDMGKTVVACLIGGYMSYFFIWNNWTLGVLLAGLGCELGHMFPAFYGFKGGKGILCGGTLVWMLDWRVGLIAWCLFAALWLLTRYVSLGSIASAVSLPISVFIIFGHDVAYTVISLVISVLVIWCHRENIARLLRGEERKFRWHSGPPKE